MKIKSKKHYFLLLLFVITSGVVFAQPQLSFYNKLNNFEFEIIPKMGFATFKESGNVPLNGFVNGGDVLTSLKINKKLNLLTGLGYFEFDGNRNMDAFSSSLKNSYLHIPLMLKSDISIFKENPQNKNIFLELGIGLYTNSLFRQEIITINNVFVDKNLGWNFGLSADLGVKFILSEVFNLGIGFECQNDFTKINHNIETLQGVNTINLLLGFSF